MENKEFKKIKKIRCNEKNEVVEEKEVTDINEVLENLDLEISDSLRVGNFEKACNYIMQKNTLKSYMDTQNQKDKVYGFKIVE